MKTHVPESITGVVASYIFNVGFIVMDGNGCLYGTLTGNHCEVKHKLSGQPYRRFALLRAEAKHNYVRKCAAVATQQFINDDQVFFE